jgi:hypothetical protein
MTLTPEDAREVLYMIRMSYPLQKVVFVLFGLGFVLSGCSSNEMPQPPAKGLLSKELMADENTVKRQPSSGTVSSQSDGVMIEKSKTSVQQQSESHKALEGVALEPSSPITGDRLRARASLASSVQTPPELVYRWKINGQMVQDSQSEALQNPVKRGDYVEVEVAPSLGGSGSLHGVSNYVMVGNAPPTMSLEGQTIGNEGAYQAKVTGTDPDGDNFELSIKEGPSGMTIDSGGNIRWAMDSKVEGVFSVAVSARDVHGAESSLNYQIKIHRESNGKAS